MIRFAWHYWLRRHHATSCDRALGGQYRRWKCHACRKSWGHVCRTAHGDAR